jgi:hypothetical protein
MRRMWWAWTMGAALAAGCATAPGAARSEAADAAVTAPTTPSVARRAPAAAGPQSPGGQIPGGQVPGGQVPGGQVPGAQSPGARTPADAPSVAEDEDGFNLRIDAGRISVLNGKIADALAGMRSPYEPHESESILAVRQRDLREAAAAVRQAAYDFLRLEADACAQGKFATIACAGGPPPRWLGERPDAAPSPAELRRRLDALLARMQPLLDQACAQGKRETKDEMYCSVE